MPLTEEKLSWTASRQSVRVVRPTSVRSAGEEKGGVSGGGEERGYETVTAPMSKC